MAIKENNDVKSILTKVKLVTDKIKSDKNAKRANGENFNLFSILGIEQREVYICKVMCELLNPQGAHGLGGVFLENFLQNVLGEKELAGKADLAEVKSEDSTEEYRRIDFTISWDDTIIPIEAKINAGDQNHQLADYYQDVVARVGKCKYIVYLTKDADAPSPISMKSSDGQINLTPANIKKLSWKSDILCWLQYCEKLNSVKSNKPVTVCLQQLANTINDWGINVEHQGDEILFEEIKQYGENEQNLFIDIWSCIEHKRQNLWGEFTRAVISSLEKIHNIKQRANNYDIVEFWYKENETVGDYSKKLSISMILYRCSKGTYVGFRTYFNGKLMRYDQAGFDKEDFQKFFPQIKELNPPAGWPWIHSEKLPDGIDFYKLRGATMKLMFGNNMADYVAKVVDLILQRTGWGKQESP